MAHDDFWAGLIRRIGNFETEGFIALSDAIDNGRLSRSELIGLAGCLPIFGAQGSGQGCRVE